MTACKGAVESPTKFLKREEGLTASQFLEGVCWERRGAFFRRGIAVFT